MIKAIWRETLDVLYRLGDLVLAIIILITVPVWVPVRKIIRTRNNRR